VPFCGKTRPDADFDVYIEGGQKLEAVFSSKEHLDRAKNIYLKFKCTPNGRGEGEYYFWINNARVSARGVLQCEAY
jgi:hypothetical protein